jgi:hypothetical protein
VKGLEEWFNLGNRLIRLQRSKLENENDDEDENDKRHDSVWGTSAA